MYSCTVEGCDYTCHTFQTMSQHFKRVHEVCNTVSSNILPGQIISACCDCRYTNGFLLMTNRLGEWLNINAISVIRCSLGVTLLHFTFVRSMSWSGPLDIPALGESPVVIVILSALQSSGCDKYNLSRAEKSKNSNGFLSCHTGTGRMSMVSWS